MNTPLIAPGCPDNASRALESARAFGEGSDARIRGLGLEANPYSNTDKMLRVNWKLGWHDVAYHFGLWVKGRWPVKELPLVRFSDV